MTDDLRERLVADLQEHPGAWLTDQITRRLGLEVEDRRRVARVLTVLREEGAIRGYKPRNGKGQYGHRDVEWSARRA